MGKINIFAIVHSHFRSIFDDGWIVNLINFVVFFLVPAAASVPFFRSSASISVELRDLLVTVFAIFSALLFSAQIGLFTLRRSDSYRELPKIEASVRQKKDDVFNEFLRGFSANTSYLILISALALFLFAFECLMDPTGKDPNQVSVLDGALIFLSFHFFLSLLMVLKRFFVAYEASY